MNDKQRKSLELSTRSNAAAILTRILDGRRDTVPVDKSVVSRWCTEECMSPLGYVLLLIWLLPERQAAELLSVIEDAYDDAHGGPLDLTLEEALLAADLSDSAEDNARARVAIWGASQGELQKLIATTYTQDHDSRILRQLARREMRRRFWDPLARPMRPSERRREARAS